MISGKPSESFAIFDDEQSGTIRMINIGEKISGLTLTQIYENRIVLQKDEANFVIFMGRNTIVRTNPKVQKEPEVSQIADQKQLPAIETPKNSNVIRKELKRKEVKERLNKEWESIIRDARFIPNTVDGSIQGFKITSLPKRSIISEIGIRKNDILREINGVELNNMATLFTLYTDLASENEFELVLERDGKTIQYIYIIK